MCPITKDACARMRRHHCVHRPAVLPGASDAREGCSLWSSPVRAAATGLCTAAEAGLQCHRSTRTGEMLSWWRTPVAVVAVLAPHSTQHRSGGCSTASVGASLCGVAVAEICQRLRPWYDPTACRGCCGMEASAWMCLVHLSLCMVHGGAEFAALDIADLNLPLRRIMMTSLLQ